MSSESRSGGSRRSIVPIVLLLAIALALSAGACSERRQVHSQSTVLRPSDRVQQEANKVAKALSKLLPGALDPEHRLFELAPRFGLALAERCRSHACDRVALLSLFPAGRGVMARPSVFAGEIQFEMPPVFLRLKAGDRELMDQMPSEIESGPRQLAVRGAVTLEPEEGSIQVDAYIEILSADQRYLLFDFFDSAEAQVEGLQVGDKNTALRHTRQGSLLVVELQEGTRSAQLRFQYRATLQDGTKFAPDFVLYENWMPYLGGRATWHLEIDVPEAFDLGIPTQRVESSAAGRKRFGVRADSLDRYPIVGSNLSYATDTFEHQGTVFEIWLRPEHKDALPRVADSLRRSMDAFSSLGAFPSERYRVLEAPYAGGHGAFGLRDLMVLGEDLLDEKHLLPALAHELAHAWFAGLLRDPQGRWSEGLASYLSQWPLSKKRARMMRWGWMVAYEQVPANRDLALQGERPAPRHDDDLAGSIFYGKAALVLQQLEERVGIAKMRQILSLFVYQYRGRSVRWRELQQSVADVMGNREARRFGEWLEEGAAPDWELRVLKMENSNVEGELWQRADFPFEGTVQIATMSEQSEILSMTPLSVSGGRSEFSMKLPADARWLVVDPNYTMPRLGNLEGKERWMLRVRE